MSHRLAFSFTLVAATLALSTAACTVEEAADTADTAEAVNSASVGSIQLSIVGDSDFKLSLVTSKSRGKGVRAALSRGSAFATYDECILSGVPGPNGGRLERVTCGAYEVTRSGDAYSIAISEHLQKNNLGLEPLDPDDPILPLKLADKRELRVTQSSDVHPFAVTARIDEGLRALVGAPYGSRGPIRDVERWFALRDFSPQPSFAYGDGTPPYPVSDRCYTSLRPSIFADPADREKGLASAEQYAQRYRAMLERDDAPPGSCE